MSLDNWNTSQRHDQHIVQDAVQDENKVWTESDKSLLRKHNLQFYSSDATHTGTFQ